MMPKVGVDRLLKLRDLPTLPLMIEKLRVEMQDPETNAEKISAIIQNDPAMMLRILKVINSALHGMREPVHSLNQAIVCLGLKSVHNIAMTTAVLDIMTLRGQTDFDRLSYWKHCICTGIAANVVCDACDASFRARYDRGMLHLAGILHDIGKVVYELHFHHEFMTAIQLSRDARVSLISVEDKILGMDHAMVGGWLAGRWGLPFDLVDVIRWHHQIEMAGDGNRQLVALCHLADFISNSFHLGNGGDTTSPALDPQVWEVLGLREDGLQGLGEQATEQAAHSEVLLAFVEGVHPRH